MYCLDAGILQKETIPETPQQNGLAERCNRTLLEIERCLLIDSGLPRMMWGAAILHATSIWNLVVRRREEKCPTELMRCEKPKISINKLSSFGRTVFMRKRDRHVSKLEALEGKLVGYTEGDNGYLVYVPKTRKVVGRGFLRVSIPSNKVDLHCEFKICLYARLFFKSPMRSQDSRSEDIASISRKETAA